MRGGYSNRRGSFLFLILALICVLVILGFSLATIRGQRYRQTHKQFETVQAVYVAEACVHKALTMFRSTFDHPLVYKKKNEQKPLIHAPLLDLLDMDRARKWARTVTLVPGEVHPSGTAIARLELLALRANPFQGGIDAIEKVPPGLEPYRLSKSKRRDESLSLHRPLGGWSGLLRILAKGTVGRSHWHIDVVHPIHVLDLTAPAAAHTLLVRSDKREVLKEGRFILSNMDLPPELSEIIRKLLSQLELQINPEADALKVPVRRRLRKLNRNLAGGFGCKDPADALSMVKTMTAGLRDRDIADRLDNIILSLDPRNWGRIRTCGTLEVYLPFFAADDVINYIAGDDLFASRRREVGYLFHENRLHDPYTSAYTRFEGHIFKRFRRVLPGNRLADAPLQRYTVNTLLNYARRHPKARILPFLERLRDNVRQYNLATIRNNARLRGSAQRPLRLDGLLYSRGRLSLGGHFKGRCLLVSKGQITVTDDLVPADKRSRLGLVSLESTVTVAERVRHARVHASIYAEHGIRGARNQSVLIRGNLAVNHLHRQRMPKYFTCRYDRGIQNRSASNVAAMLRLKPVLRSEGAISTERRRR